MTIQNEFLYGAEYYDKVKVKCDTCKTIQLNKMYYAMDDTPYKDDFFIKCNTADCKNTEEGQLPLQNFSDYEFIERVFKQ